MKKLMTLFFCLLFPSILSAQVKVTGMVVDMNKNPLEGVIIQAKDASTKKMITFTRSDYKGNFRLNLHANSYLECAYLGFKKKVIHNITSSPLHIVMEPDNFTLKEVKVKADRVRINGDTLNYTVGAFASKNDKSIGDVLARIPGFDVNKKNGQISYEGKSISNFYIEGLDMLGNKYGTATSTLPQQVVGTVQVMQHHQPIRVLENFTFSDDVAINLKMKKDAKSHWVNSIDAGTGFRGGHLLWDFSGLAMRLKDDFQTMLTYKTNNVGKNIGRETEDLFNFNKLNDDPTAYIQLAPPTTPSLDESRTLFNTSHAVFLNTLKRLSPYSQTGLQMIYTYEDEKAEGMTRTEYLRQDGNRIIVNDKDFHDKNNKLYTQWKYEKNGEKLYLKNTLIGDFSWDDQRLAENLTWQNFQKTRLPVYHLKDNLYMIREYGKKLLSFYSDNSIVSTPQYLLVDSLRQDVHQQNYTTDDYIRGSLKIGEVVLSFRTGINAQLHRIQSSLYGLPDSIGKKYGKDHFGYVKFYAEPEFEYDTSDFDFSLEIPVSFLYEKYSEDKRNYEWISEPLIRIRWQATPRLRFSIQGGLTSEPLDAGRFHSSLILQDYEYINQGYSGYWHQRSKNLSANFLYQDAIHGTHALITVNRSFTTDPYSSTRDFTGNYIIQSASSQQSKSKNWNAIAFFSKGFNFLHSVFNLRGNYNHSNTSLIEDGVSHVYQNDFIHLRSSLDLSFYQNMHLTYGITYSRNQMESESLSSNTTVNNWDHDWTLTVPIKIINFDLQAEYDHNQLLTKQYKDFFLADVGIKYEMKHIRWELNFRNIFNKKTYSYVLNENLIHSCSTNRIRGREITISASFHL
jgi:hypothetical protein